MLVFFSDVLMNRYNDFRRSAATLISCTPPWMGPARTLVGLKEVPVLRNGVVIYRLVKELNDALVSNPGNGIFIFV